MWFHNTINTTDNERDCFLLTLTTTTIVKDRLAVKYVGGIVIK